MLSKNIYNVKFCYTEQDLNTLEERAEILQKQYAAGIPDNIKIQKHTFVHIPKFYISELSFSNNIRQSNIKSIADYFKMTEENAYIRYAPVFITKRLCMQLNDVAADQNGNLYLIANKKISDELKHFMNMYCYQFKSSKNYRYDSDAVILYFSLN